MTISFNSVSVQFGPHPALRDMTLVCHDGAATCLVGPNGAGKSTALAVAAGLLKPGAGTVMIGGRRVIPFSAPMGVSYLPQASRFPGVMTGAEVLELTSSLCEPDRTEYQEVLEATGVAPILDRRISELSGGWTRRLGLAAALIQPAKVVLLDEPLVGLDPATLDYVLLFFDRMVRDGGTLVMATHEFELIDALSPYLAVLDDGAVAATYEPGNGPSRTLYRMALRQLSPRLEETKVSAL